MWRDDFRDCCRDGGLNLKMALEGEEKSMDLRSSRGTTNSRLW